MEEEIKYRRGVLAPILGAELKRTREFGDLSENAEYKEAVEQNIELNKRIEDLDKRIEEFNKSRHWWERKLKV